MQLHFLGAEYSTHLPSVEVREGEVAGKYRGATWSAKHYSPVVGATTPVTLRFMGRSYQTQV